MRQSILYIEIERNHEDVISIRLSPFVIGMKRKKESPHDGKTRILLKERCSREAAQLQKQEYVLAYLL